MYILFHPIAQVLGYQDIFHVTKHKPMSQYWKLAVFHTKYYYSGKIVPWMPKGICPMNVSNKFIEYI